MGRLQARLYLGLTAVPPAWLIEPVADRRPPAVVAMLGALRAAAAELASTPAAAGMGLSAA